jgi:hypothetical protein
MFFLVLDYEHAIERVCAGSQRLKNCYFVSNFLEFMAQFELP